MLHRFVSSHFLLVMLLISALATVCSAAPAARHTPSVHVKRTTTIDKQTSPVVHIAFSPNGERLATSSKDGRVQLWDARTFTKTTLLDVPAGFTLASFSWGLDGTRLATYSYTSGFSFSLQHTLHLWDARNGELLLTFPPSNDESSSSWLFSFDWRSALRIMDGRRVELWDVARAELRYTFEQEPPKKENETRSLTKALLTGKKWRSSDSLEGYARAEWSPDGHTVLTASAMRPSKLWDTTTGRLLATFDDPSVDPQRSPHSFQPRAYHSYGHLFSSDGSLLAVPYREGILLWDVRGNRRQNFLTDAGSPERFTADGRTLVTQKRVKPNSTNGELLFWDVATGTLLRRFANSRLNAYNRLFWRPDERAFIALSGKRARIFDLTANTEITKLPYGGCTSDSLFGTGGCAPFIFGADGRIAVKVTDKVRLWDMANGKLIVELKEARTPLAFSPDGHTLVTRDRDDKTMIVWKVVIAD